MEKILLYSIAAIFSAYIVFDRFDHEANNSRLNDLEIKSNKLDSSITEYEFKIDSLYKVNDSLFAKMDYGINFVDSSIDSIESKTEIEIDSSHINEALLWADSVSQYY